MPSISGTYVGSGLSPGNTLNTHETHRAKYGQGGYRTVATTTERNQIPPLRREEGMLVYVVADGLVYILKPGAPLIGNTTNGNWDIFNTGGGGPTPPTISFGVTGNTTKFVNATTSSITNLYDRDVFSVSSTSGESSLIAAVTSAGTGTSSKARFYFKGLLLENQ